jgi:predicted nucleotidyltransferase
MVNTSWLKARKLRINKEDIQKALKSVAEKQQEIKERERKKFLETN